MDKVVSNAGCSRSFGGTPPTGWEGEVLTLKGLYQNSQGALPQRAGTKTAMQMHYNESRCYLEAGVERESICSAPLVH